MHTDRVLQHLLLLPLRLPRGPDQSYELEFGYPSGYCRADCVLVGHTRDQEVPRAETGEYLY